MGQDISPRNIPHIQHTRSLLPGLSLQSLSCVWQKGGCGRRESRSQKGSLIYREGSVLLVTLARTERDGLELLKPLLLYLGPSCQSLSRVNYRVRSHSIGAPASLCFSYLLQCSLEFSSYSQATNCSSFTIFRDPVTPIYIHTPQYNLLLTLVKTLWHVSCSSNMGRTVGRFQCTHCSAWRVPCSLWSVVLSLPE